MQVRAGDVVARSWHPLPCLGRLDLAAVDIQPGRAWPKGRDPSVMPAKDRGEKLRRLIIALIACAWGVPAASHCDDEAQAARTRIWDSGPFHFEMTRWSNDVRTKVCGEIVPGVAQRERSCDAVGGTGRETVWIGDRKWEKDGAGWRGPYPTIWTHQDRVPAAGLSFSAGRVTCLGRVVSDGRAMNKYEFAKQIAGRLWVETIFTDEQSGLPVRFEMRGRSDASSGSTAIYRHDPSIRVDPLSVDSDKRWSESLRRLSQEAEKGDRACRAGFSTAVQRGKMAAFAFEITGAVESTPCCLTGSFVPFDAIQYAFKGVLGGVFGETVAADGRAWARKSYPPPGWVEAPEKLDVVGKIVRTLFPPSEHVGQVKCLGGVSVDGRDHDWYEYDFYRDSESARTLYSHRSMIVEKATGIPFRTVSVSRTRAHQWVETRRYDPALSIQVPPPEPAQEPSVVSMPPGSGSAGAYWPPHGPNWPPFIMTPPADADWPTPGR
jgi:hypothetical protein